MSDEVRDQDLRPLLRFTKGATPALQGLRLVLDPQSTPCPVCDDDGSACLNCLGVGWVIEDD